MEFPIFTILIGVFVSTSATTVGQEDVCIDGALRESLIVSMPRNKDMAAQHSFRCSENTEGRQQRGMSLGFVTPWNNHGYDIAKWMGHKFTHISPVWLQLRHNADMKYKITGTHDVDAKWMREVKRKGAKIVPRLLFDGWLPQQIEELQDAKAREKIVKLIANVVKKYGFDGIVLEGWIQLIASGHVELAVEFIELLSIKLRELEKDFILVIPALRGPQTIFGSKHFDLLEEFVTAFSVMTYDYSNFMRTPGPTSPLNWLKQCVEHIVPSEGDPRRKKILLGLNCYGYHFVSGASEPILGDKFIELVQSMKGKMKLDKEASENYVEVRTKQGRHTIYFPTLWSIKMRLDLAEQLGIGVAMWELGQGLDYFYDLL